MKSKNWALDLAGANFSESALAEHPVLPKGRLVHLFFLEHFPLEEPSKFRRRQKKLEGLSRKIRCHTRNERGEDLVLNAFIQNSSKIPIPKWFACHPESRIFKTQSRIQIFSNSISNPEFSKLNPELYTNAIPEYFRAPPYVQFSLKYRPLSQWSSFQKLCL